MIFPIPEAVQHLRTFAEAHKDAPEGLEFFDWWWVPYGTSAYVPEPYETSLSLVGDGSVPPHMPPVVSIHPRAYLHLRGPAPESGAFGWDVRTRQAAVFYRNGFGRLRRKEPEKGRIDRLAEEGTVFVQADNAREFRETMRSLVDSVLKGFEEGGVPWEEQERMRELRDRLGEEP